MRAIQLRQTCTCGLSFRYPHDFEEHKRVGCVVQSGKGESLVADPDASPIEEVITEAPAQEVEPKKQGRKK